MFRDREEELPAKVCTAPTCCSPLLTIQLSTQLLVVVV